MDETQHIPGIDPSDFGKGKDVIGKAINELNMPPDNKKSARASSSDKVSYHLGSVYRIVGEENILLSDYLCEAASQMNIFDLEFIESIFEDYKNLYYLNLSPDVLNKHIPDDQVIYKNVEKIVVLISTKNKLTAKDLDQKVRDCIEQKKEFISFEEADSEYQCFYLTSVFSKNGNICILFLGNNPVASTPAENNIKVHESKKIYSESPLFKPKEIFKLIGDQVIGQDEAKKTLSVILYEHLLRSCNKSEKKDLRKTNALLVGPSGCGKTLTAKALADVAEVPFVRLDATAFVVRGYRGGMHVEQIVDILLSAARADKVLAQRGIVFMDEIDKIRSAGDDDWDLAAASIQSELLPIIDGGNFYYESDHLDCERVEFSFKDVLFIFGGAFERCGSNIETCADLVQYGFIPEFANRMGTIIRMEKTTSEIIENITRKAVSEYARMLSFSKSDENVYTELVMSMILANKSLLDMGGRCVNPIVRRFFEDRIFEL